MFRPNSGHGVKNFEGEPHSIFQAPTIGIRPQIAQRREKLMQKIPMRRMQLSHLKPDTICPNSCIDEGRLDPCKPGRI